MKVIQIGIADDHQLFREGVRTLLNKESDMFIVWEAGNSKEVLDNLQSNKVDLILLDINMPDLNGIDLLPKLKASYPEIRVIMLSMHQDDKYIYDSVKNGADSYLTKDTDPLELMATIRHVIENGVYFNPQTAKAVSTSIANPTADSPKLQFGARELEVLQLICDGKTNAEIADKIFRATRTVEGYRQRLLEKTHTRNTADLVAYALRSKLVE